jgi:ankyrin repeat protein
MRLKASFNEMSLRRAAKRGDLETVRRLAGKGIDVNARSEAEKTALMAAAEKGRLEVARFLTEHGADINAPDSWGFSALVRALKNGHWDVARLLVEKGADVNSKPTEQHSFTQTPFTMAASFGDPGMLQFLLDHGADIETVNGDGKTALLIVAEIGCVDCVRLLIDRGADVHSAASFFDTHNYQTCHLSDETRQAIGEILKDEMAAESAARAARHHVAPRNSGGAHPGKKPHGFSL